MKTRKFQRRGDKRFIVEMYKDSRFGSIFQLSRYFLDVDTRRPTFGKFQKKGNPLRKEWEREGVERWKKKPREEKKQNIKILFFFFSYFETLQSFF